MIFKNADFKDIDLELFKQFHEKKYEIPFEGDESSLPQTFENLNLASDITIIRGQSRIWTKLLFACPRFSRTARSVMKEGIRMQKSMGSGCIGIEMVKKKAKPFIKMGK